MKTAPADIVFETPGAWPEVTVIVPLYNYAGFVERALDSVAEQTLPDRAVLVVDDASTDNSVDVAERWLSARHPALSKAMLIRNQANAGLSISRNTGAARTQSELLFFLDADNLLYSRCLAKLRDALARSDAAFAYPLLEVFGADSGVMGTEVFSRDRLAAGNYIDAMAMIRRSALLAHEGYADLGYGWEDYDLWLRFCESGANGVQVPEILARYRVHPRSMLRTVTNDAANLRALTENIRRRHPWVTL